MPIRLVEWTKLALSSALRRDAQLAQTDTVIPPKYFEHSCTLEVEMTSAQALLDVINEGEPSLAARLREASLAAEQATQLPDELVHAMRDAGLMRMWRPKEYGGLGCDFETGIRVFEELARHDAAAGWNAHISNVVDIYGAWFPDAGSERVFNGPDSMFSGALNPPFMAKPTERDGVAGYELSGRAPFASGITHADHVLALAAVPPAEPEAPPSVFFTLIPQAQLRVHRDTWNTLGMRATGSFDVEAEAVFVPADQFIALMPRQSVAKAYTEGQLYRLTMWPLVSALGAPALGVARAAVDDFIALAKRKTPFYTQRALNTRDVVQSQIARAEAKLEAARAYFYQGIQDAWNAVSEPGTSLSQEHKYRIQLGTCYAIEQAAEVVDMVFKLAGSSGFRRGKDPRSDMQLRFEKHLRDANTMTQHAFGSSSRYESVGQVMLGLDSDWPFFAF